MTTNEIFAVAGLSRRMWLKMAAEDDPVIWPVFAHIPLAQPMPQDPKLQHKMSQ